MSIFTDDAFYPIANKPNDRMYLHVWVSPSDAILRGDKEYGTRNFMPSNAWLQTLTQEERMWLAKQRFYCSTDASLSVTAFTPHNVYAALQFKREEEKAAYEMELGQVLAMSRVNLVSASGSFLPPLNDRKWEAEPRCAEILALAQAQAKMAEEAQWKKMQEAAEARKAMQQRAEEESAARLATALKQAKELSEWGKRYPSLLPAIEQGYDCLRQIRNMIVADVDNKLKNILGGHITSIQELEDYEAEEAQAPDEVVLDARQFVEGRLNTIALPSCVTLNLSRVQRIQEPDGEWYTGLIVTVDFPTVERHLVIKL